MNEDNDCSIEMLSMITGKGYSAIERLHQTSQSDYYTRNRFAH